MRAFSFMLVVFLVPARAHAQWPPEIRGRVVDAVTGTPVPGARVRVSESPRSAESDPGGAFLLRGLDPGPCTLTFTALGYKTSQVDLRLRNGRVARPRVELTPEALPVAGVDVRGRAGAEGVRVLDRSRIVRSGSRTVGDLLRDLPGVTVRSRGAGSSQQVTIRGDDAVLVLLDGAPVNDPVTGNADLSTLPTATVESVTVLPGARSARFGPRAQGGVVAIRTRQAGRRPSARVGVASLGGRSAELGAGGQLGDVRLGAEVGYQEQSGAFDYRIPSSLGGGRGRRENADVQRFHGSVGSSLKLLGGDLRLRLTREKLKRGIPGKSFSPSDSAREEEGRTRGTVGWTREGARSEASLAGYLVRERLRIQDPAPSLGPAYDDRTRMTEEGVRGRLERRLGGGDARLGAGAELTRRTVRASALSVERATRLDAGGWIRGEADLDGDGPLPGLAATLRLDRSGATGRWYPTHDVTLRSDLGAFSLHLSHRSAFTPPTLGDELFRDGVAVQPNPGLRAERVPGEVETGVSWGGRLGPVRVDLGADAYRGSVRDMIVWAPDFRFVWSPRNVDAVRSGAELTGSVDVAPAGLHVDGSFSRARLVYDRSDGKRAVQVAYRPRHTGAFHARWEGSGFRAELDGRFLGQRTTDPSAANLLPAFWTFDLLLGRRWRWSGWLLQADVRIDRLLDRRNSFIFAYPEPGRTLRLALSLAAPSP